MSSTGAKGWLPLAGIVIAVFVFNTSEFMPMALLTDIAGDFGISESAAGMVITAYAWVVALLSLPLMLLFRNTDYRRLLIMTVAVFVVFQGLSAVSDSYWMLVISRVGVACAHALFWSIASPLAVRVVPPEHRALALSAVVTGTSIAMVVGLPFGRAVGLALGWRMTFAVVGLIALGALVLLALVFPHVRNEGTFSLGDARRVISNRILVCIYIITIVFVTGHYLAYSYIEPFLGQVAGQSENMITLMLAILGAAGILGSLMFARLYARHKEAFISSIMIAVTLCLALLLPLSSYTLTLIPLLVVWGAFMTAYSVSFQSELIRSTPADGQAVAMSLFSGLFNVGIGMGSLLGGVVTDNVSISDIGYFGAAFVIAAAAICFLFLFRYMRARDREEHADL